MHKNRDIVDIATKIQGLRGIMSDAEKLYNLLKEAFFLLDDGDRRLLSDFNLTVPRFYALFHISEDPGISSSQLSDQMLCDKSNITRITKGLEGEGYIARRPHESDGRSLRWFLTETGTAVFDSVASRHKNYNEFRFNGLNNFKQDSLEEMLLELNDQLREILTQPEK